MGLHERLLRSAGMTYILRRECRPTEDDYLSVTLIVNITLLPEGTPTHRTDAVGMKDFLVAMRRVRPDLMEWLVTPDGEPKTRFTRDEHEYARALFEDYKLWRLKQTA